MDAVLNISFYKFFDNSNYQELKENLIKLCQKTGVLGTVLIAREGINGNLAGPPDSVAQIKSFLLKFPDLSDLIFKESWSQSIPFKKLNIKFKRDILTFRGVSTNPRAKTGNYLPPNEMRALLENSPQDLVLIDTRNDFEYEMGTFRNAINPKTVKFSDFVEFVRAKKDDLKDKKVITFCTGGIRCEKATAFMIQEGIQQVYQLEGGILSYFEKTDGKFFDGHCFVFDERRAVDTQLRPVPQAK